MAEPMSQGFDQTCGRCYGNRTILVEKLLVMDGKPMSMTVPETCPACGGAGRIGGQTQ
jgi:DnaJ-class molecular chaperone